MLPGVLDFAAARIGKHVRSAWGLGNECVDLVELWAAALGEGVIWGNAVDLWADADPKQWAQVPNTPTDYPPDGAIVVWHPASSVGIGGNGHTAIALMADAQWLLTLDQNWPEGAPVAVVLHTYAGVTGWLVRR